MERPVPPATQDRILDLMLDYARLVRLEQAWNKIANECSLKDWIVRPREFQQGISVEAYLKYLTQPKETPK